MNFVSYKEYLDFLEDRTSPKLLKRLAVIIMLFLFAATGGLTSHIYYNSKTSPILEENRRYLQIASAGFSSQKQVHEELLEAFKVAGAKIEAVEVKKEATLSALGYFVTLEDLDKMLSRVELAKENSQLQRTRLQEFRLLPQYSNFNSNLIFYYDESERALNTVWQEHQNVRSIVLALGPSLHLPVLESEQTWKNANLDEIRNYYESLKKDADVALANLAKLNTSGDFRAYVDLEIKYLELVVNVADGVVRTLTDDSQNSEDAPQIERAYQIVSSSKQENIVLLDKLIKERLKVFDLKTSVARFSASKLIQDSLERQLTEIKPPESN